MVVFLSLYIIVVQSNKIEILPPTVFFIISGYGIYWSIDNAKSNGDFNYKRYMIKRFIKLSSTVGNNCLPA